MIAADTVVDGRYKLIRKIGTGGMADVWCAEDAHLGRQVALKILHSRFAQDHEFVERFRREASAAAGLQHPNVVSVFDRGEVDGTYYIAMELLEGETLKQRIARGLEIPAALEIMRQILSASRFAHERGIIHRDLKPQNVIISPEGKATVTDFGIAHAGASEITQTGSVMGTASYLSPEQAQGLPVTAASDLYSIGVILYECLTGRVPFEADSSVAVALKQVSEVPLRPSALEPGVSPALDAVVMRALAKDPAQRFASADAFRAALDQAEANPGQPSADNTAAYVLPPPAAAAGTAGTPGPGWTGDTQGFWTRRRIVLAVLGVLLAAAAAFALTRPERVTVPTVVGTAVESASRLLESEGFDVNIDTVVNDAPTDTVLEQDPTAGSKANKGSTVVLTVSSGPGTAPIPDVRGLRASDATERLQRAGFEVKEKKRFDKDIPEGDAIGTSPGRGVQVRRGTTIALFVSKGTDQVAAPSVVGLSQGSARAAIRDAELIPELAEERDDPAPAGEVLEQTPSAGTLLDKGSTVQIVVSTGRFQIKNVVGFTEARAVKTLRNQGLSVRVEQRATATESQDGIVLDQFPQQGSTVSRGDSVTITVGVFAGPPGP